MKRFLVVTLCLVASAGYAGVTINGTTITFNDSTVQSTAKPLDHGGTNNTVIGMDSFIGGGYSNLVTDDFGTVGGGYLNQAGDNDGSTSDRKWATVSGGQINTASGYESTIGGGRSNTASGLRSTVGGGRNNTASASYSSVGGGNSNLTTDQYGTIGGGLGNQVGDNLGIPSDKPFATVSGGQLNTASGSHSTVSGGRYNVASGNDSFAAGRIAISSHNNSFVWGGALGNGGGSFDPRTSAGVDTFNVWSAGGIYLNGAVHAASDHNMKEAFSFVSARDVLDKVGELPVTTWRFKSEDDSIRHIGPVAQDFMAAFGYGVNDTHITATDADGVALAAIQGLYAMQREKDEEITALRWHNAQLEARLARLEKAILRASEHGPTGTD